MHRVRRRQFLIAASAMFAVPRASIAQQVSKVWRIGYLGLREPANPKFITGPLQRLGYEEGRNLVVERRYGRGKSEQLPLLAAELVRLEVDLILAIGDGPALAAQQATRTIPVVMVSTLPVVNGVIESYARPGGNVTGMDWWPSPEMADKNYGILKEIVPGATRAVRIWNPKQPYAHLFGDAHVRRIAVNAGLTLVAAELTNAEGLAGALEQIVASRAEVLYVSGHESIVPHYREIAAFAVKRKLVAISDSFAYTRAGGLLHRGADFSVISDRLANYIARILQGAKPADLPVELPTKYELVLNKTTAKAMGLTLSPSFMLQVDRIIE